MKANFADRSRLTGLRAYVLAIILSLISTSAGMAKAQGQGIDSPSDSSLPRVTAVDGRIEVGKIITGNTESSYLADHAALTQTAELRPKG